MKGGVFLELIIALGIFIVLVLLLLGNQLKLMKFMGSGVVKLVIGASFLFLVNVVGSSFSLHIPINAVTVVVSGTLGVPGIVGLFFIQHWVV